MNEFHAGVSFNNNPMTPPLMGKEVAQELGITGLVDNLPDIPGMPHVSLQRPRDYRDRSGQQL